MAKPQTLNSVTNTDGTKTSYDRWVESEGIPVIKTFFVEDIRQVKLERWERKGGHGAFLQMEGAGQVNNCYICEISPGKSLKPQRQLFEETIYILSGRGATTVWNSEEQKQTFEWQAGSLFSPPLNTRYQHFNGQGNEAARLFSVNSMPIVFNLFHNEDFIFSTPRDFTDRFDGEADYFSGKGKSHPGRIWDTNFIADARNFMVFGNLQGEGIPVVQGLTPDMIQVLPERGVPGSTAVTECLCTAEDPDSCDVSSVGRAPDFVVVNLGAGFPLPVPFPFVNLGTINLRVSVRMPMTGS